MGTAIAQDDAVGALKRASGAAAGTVNYAGQSLLLYPDQIVAWPVPDYEEVECGSEIVDGQEIISYKSVLTGYELQDTLARMPANGTVKVRYRVAGDDTTANEQITVDAFDIDLTKGYAETITPGSARFVWGGHEIQHVVNQGLLRDIDPATGVGSAVGTLDVSSGIAHITSWVGGGTNVVQLKALTTQVGGQPVDSCAFRTPVSPIRNEDVSSLIAICDQCLVNGFGSVTLDSLVVSNGVATASLSTGYGFSMISSEIGPVLQIAGATPADLNGDWRSYSVDFATTFTFLCPSLSHGPASGVITAKVAPLGWAKQYSGTDRARLSTHRSGGYQLPVAPLRRPFHVHKHTNVGVDVRCGERH